MKNKLKNSLLLCIIFICSVFLFTSNSYAENVFNDQKVNPNAGTGLSPEDYEKIKKTSSSGNLKRIDLIWWKQHSHRGWVGEDPLEALAPNMIYDPGPSSYGLEGSHILWTIKVTPNKPVYFYVKHGGRNSQHCDGIYAELKIKNYNETSEKEEYISLGETYIPLKRFEDGSTKIYHKRSTTFINQKAMIIPNTDKLEIQVNYLEKDRHNKYKNLSPIGYCSNVEVYQ